MEISAIPLLLMNTNGMNFMPLYETQLMDEYFEGVSGTLLVLL